MSTTNIYIQQLHSLQYRTVIQHCKAVQTILEHLKPVEDSISGTRYQILIVSLRNHALTSYVRSHPLWSKWESSRSPLSDVVDVNTRYKIDDANNHYPVQTIKDDHRCLFTICQTYRTYKRCYSTRTNGRSAVVILCIQPGERIPAGNSKSPPGNLAAREIWSVDSQENYWNCCHQMSHCKANMHQIQLWPGLHQTPS